MGFRLVIDNDGETTRHEVRPEGVVLGRDPSCEIHIPDKRLSRRHVRFEPGRDGIRLQDLGSRNGCWIDTKRVEDAMLRPGTKARLGGLVVAVESDVPETATVQLDARALEPSGEQTVMLPKSEPAPKSAPPSPADVAQPSADATLLLRNEPSDTARQPVSPQPSITAKTRILTPADLSPPAPSPPSHPEPEASEPALDLEEEEGVASYSWPTRFVLVTTGLALIVYLTLAFPLMRTLSNALQQESLRRGHALLDVIAARNEAMVGEGRLRDLSVETVLREERVKEALLIDLEGKVLAPSSRAGEVLSRLDGINASISDVRTFYLGRRANGDYVLVQPLLFQGRRVGLAIVAYEAATASASFAVAVLFLAFLVALVAILMALVVAKRMTLVPIAALRDDVEAVIKGDASRVPEGQAFAELSEVARSVNRLVARSSPSRSRSRSQSPAVPSPPSLAAPPAEPTPRMNVPRPRVETRSSTPPTSRPEQALVSPAVVPVGPGDPGDPAATRFWVDESFIVIRTEPGAGELLGATAPIEGKHLIEAVADQVLLESVLDAVNALENQPSSEVRTATLSATASREGSHIVVALRQL